MDLSTRLFVNNSEQSIGENSGKTFKSINSTNKASLKCSDIEKTVIDMHKVIDKMIKAQNTVSYPNTRLFSGDNKPVIIEEPKIKKKVEPKIPHCAMIPTNKNQKPTKESIAEHSVRSGIQFKKGQGLLSGMAKSNSKTVTVTSKKPIVKAEKSIKTNEKPPTNRVTFESTDPKEKSSINETSKQEEMPINTVETQIKAEVIESTSIIEEPQISYEDSKPKEEESISFVTEDEDDNISIQIENSDPVSTIQAIIDSPPLPPQQENNDLDDNEESNEGIIDSDSDYF